MPARAFTPAQHRQNAAFLAALARTGNAREAADALGVHRSTYLKRRARCPAFAAAWGEAVAAAQGDRAAPRRRAPAAERSGDPPAAAPVRIDAFSEQVFLDALIEGATLRAAAYEAGVTHQSFLARARRDPGFARELALARAIGADRLLWDRTDPGDPASWSFDADLPIEPVEDTASGMGMGMSAEQAILQLMFHQPDGPFQRSGKRARNRPPPRAADWPQTERKIMAYIRAFRRAEHFAETGSWRLPEE